MHVMCVCVACAEPLIFCANCYHRYSYMTCALHSQRLCVWFDNDLTHGRGRSHTRPDADYVRLTAMVAADIEVRQRLAHAPAGPCKRHARPAAVVMLAVIALAGVLYAAPLHSLEQLLPTSPPLPSMPPPPPPLSFLILTDWHNTPTYTCHARSRVQMSP